MKPVIQEPRSQAEMDALNSDQMQLLIAQRNEVSARAVLAEALIILGEFEEALLIEEREEQKVWIQKLIKAEEREDDHRCTCVNMLDITDYARLGENATPVYQQTANYIKTYRHWSPRRQQMLWFYQCTVCGCIQSLPDDQDIDDLHAGHYAKKNQVMTDIIATMESKSGG